MDRLENIDIWVSRDVPSHSRTLFFDSIFNRINEMRLGSKCITRTFTGVILIGRSLLRGPKFSSGTYFTPVQSVDN